MYTQGQRVKRIEDRAITGATVISVAEDGAVQIAYDEGGTGWWPAECLRLIEQEG